MKLVKNDCPSCGGKLTMVNAHTVACEYCGNTYTLEPEDVAGDEPATDEVFDDGLTIEQMLARINQECDLGNSCDWFLGAERANSDKAQKRRSNLYRITGAPESEKLWGLLDTTLLDSGKKGILFLESGLHMNDEDNNVSYMSWAQFAQCEITRQSNCMKLGAAKMICQRSDELADKLRGLQKILLARGY